MDNAVENVIQVELLLQMIEVVVRLNMTKVFELFGVYCRKHD